MLLMILEINNIFNIYIKSDCHSLYRTFSKPHNLSLKKTFYEPHFSTFIEPILFTYSGAIDCSNGSSRCYS